MKTVLQNGFLLVGTLLMLELFLRFGFSRWHLDVLKTSQFVFGETLWFGRNIGIGDLLPEFDARLGWKSSRKENLNRAERPILAVFGDSWTFGLGVGEGDNYSSQLARLLPDYDVRNFGVNGYGIDQMVLNAERIDRALKPEVVLLAFIASDLHRSCFPFYFGKRKPGWLDRSGLSERPHHLIEPSELARLHRAPTQFAADVLGSQVLRLRLVQLGVAGLFQPFVEGCMSEFNANLLRRFKNRFGERGYIAHLSQELPRHFLTRLGSDGIIPIPVAELLREKAGAGYTLDSSEEHPGPRYHRAIAEIIAPLLPKARGGKNLPGWEKVS